MTNPFTSEELRALRLRLAADAHDPTHTAGEAPLVRWIATIDAMEERAEAAKERATLTASLDLRDYRALLSQIRADETRSTKALRCAALLRKLHAKNRTVRVSSAIWDFASGAVKVVVTATAIYVSKGHSTAVGYTRESLFFDFADRRTLVHFGLRALYDVLREADYCFPALRPDETIPYPSLDEDRAAELFGAARVLVDRWPSDEQWAVAASPVPRHDPEHGNTRSEGS